MHAQIFDKFPCRVLYPLEAMEIISCLCLILIFILFVSKQWLKQRKNPISLPIIGHLYLIKKPLHRTLAKLADQYGPILFLKYGFRRVLVVSSPSAVEECLTKNDIALANRPRLIVGEYLGYNYSTLVWSSYGDHWRNLRRIIALEIFSASRLQLFSSVRTAEIRALVQHLSRGSNYDNFHKLEFKTMFFELTLNILMQIIGGKRFYGENVEDLEEATQFRKMVTETFSLMGASNISDFLPFMRWFDVQGLEKRMIKAHTDRNNFMQNLIDQRREKKSDITTITTKSGEKRKTMIDVLLSLQETDSEYYTDEIIKGIISVILTAGTDTSSSTMEWAMSLLLNHPEMLEKARKEIDTHVGHDRLLEESDLPNLPYLQNIIDETLRLYPTGPVVIHESAKECSVGGFNVPEGTMILLNLWAVHRDPNAWAEPTKFKPERYDGVDKQNQGFKLIPFGSGRRRCPGEALALRMVGLTLGSLIQCFEWKRIGEEMVDMSEGAGLTLPQAKPLVAMCRPRPTMIKVLAQN